MNRRRCQKFLYYYYYSSQLYLPPYLFTEMPDCQGNPCLHGSCDEDRCVCNKYYVGEECGQFHQQGGSNIILFD